MRAILMDQSETSATGYLDSALTPSELLRALERSIEEEAKPMRDLIADEDSDCITRDLRAARLEGLWGYACCAREGGGSGDGPKRVLT